MSTVPVRSIALFTILMMGCASSTRLVTHRDATIYDNETNSAVGIGEATYRDSKPVWSSKQFRVERQGCKSQVLTISRSDDVSVFRIIAGFFVLFPWVWAGDYHASYTIPLPCDDVQISRDSNGRGEQQQQQQQQNTVVIPIVPASHPVPAPANAAGCTKDSDCKGNRLCSVSGQCVSP